MFSQSWLKFVSELNLSQDLFLFNGKKEIQESFFASTYPRDIERWFNSISIADEKAFEKALQYRSQGNQHFASKATILNALECYNQAIIHFSFKDKNNAMNLALSHGNRSAVFFELKKFQECIVDIEYALAIEKLWGFEFPTATKLKLLWRKVRSLRKVGLAQDVTDSVESFRLRLAGHRVPDNLKEWYGNLLATESLENGNLGGNGESPRRRQPMEDFPFLDSMPDTLWNKMGHQTSLLNTKVSIHTNDMYGRHFVATHEVQPGDIVLIDKAYTSVPVNPLTNYFAPEASNVGVKGYRCHNCYLETLTFIPCTSCTAVVYCSTKCKLESWTSYHRYLCGYVRFFEQAGPVERGLRIILRAGLPSLIEKISGEPPSKLTQLTGERATDFLKRVDIGTESFTSHDYCSEYEWICQLMAMPLSHKMGVVLLFASAYVISLFLLKVGFCDPRDLAVKRRLGDLVERKGRNVLWLEDDLLLDIKGAPHKGSLQLSYDMRGLDCELVGFGRRPRTKISKDATSLKLITLVAYHHLNHVSSNAYMSHMYPIEPPLAQLIGMGDSSPDIELQQIANCLFPLASLINHSCQPNTFADFMGDVMIIKAIESVKKGEQLFNSYGPVSGGRLFQSRQKLLMDKYGFACRCRACCDTNKISTELHREAIKCQYCYGPVPIELTDCLKCGRRQDYYRMKEITQEYSTMVNFDYMRKLNPASQSSLKDALPALLKFADEVLYAPNYNMSVGELCDIYSRYMVESGKMDSAIALSLRHAQITGNLFGKKGLEYGLTLSTLLEVLQKTTACKSSQTLANNTKSSVTLVEGLRSYIRDLKIECPTGKRLRIRDIEKICRDVLPIFKHHFAVENMLCREVVLNLNHLKSMINDVK